MKIYLLKFNEHDYEEYDSLVIAAPNPARAVEIMREAHKDGLPKGTPDRVEYIGQTHLTEGTILASYNAG